MRPNSQGESMVKSLIPAFVNEIEEARKHGKFVKVTDFAEEFGVK